MITFYINMIGDTGNNLARNVKKYFTKPYLDKYNIPYKVVRLSNRNPITKEFLMNVLVKQYETDRGIESLTRLGMFNPHSATLNKLAKHDAKAIRDWKLMLMENDAPLTVSRVVNWLVEHPFFVNTTIAYDDEVDVYYTKWLTEGCELACKRKTRTARRKLNYERMLLVEAADHNDDMSSAGHDDYWAKQEEEFEYTIL